MSRRRGVTVFGTAGLLVALATGAHQASEHAPSAGLESLVAAERAFAATSVKRGMRTAFLEWLAEGSIVFRPQPVDARPWFEARPEVPGMLLWEPAFAELSPADDMGWTTGPYEYRPPAGSGPSDFGHYVSVWGRQTDGSWRVLVDHGSPHAKVESTGRVDFPVHNRRGAAIRNRRADPGMTVAMLLDVDREFASQAVGANPRRAYHAVAAADARLYRGGAVPVVGRRALSSAFAERDADVSWIPEHAGASISGTLGYTFGRVRYDGRDAPAGVPDAYLRIWRKEGSRWKLVVDILPDPPPVEDPATNAE